MANCKVALGDNPFLWLAFQSNSLADNCWASKNYKSEFNKMTRNLTHEMGFEAPKLFMNMRNSREVTQAAKTVKSKYSKVLSKTEYVNHPWDSPTTKITNAINFSRDWKSSICSHIPTVIPILHEDLDQNYSRLFNIATEKGKLNVILGNFSLEKTGFSLKTNPLKVGTFDLDRTFDLDKIKEAVVNCGVEEENIFIHTFDSKHTKEDMKEFLRNQYGFLICQEELYSGMEAKSVVYCLDNHDYDIRKSKNVRATMTRACSQLNIISCYSKEKPNRFEFSSVKLDPTFIKGCDQTMDKYLFKCLSESCKKTEQCNSDGSIWICASCSLGCHQSHRIEWAWIEMREKIWKTVKQNIKCQCPTRHPLCLFKNVK